MYGKSEVIYHLIRGAHYAMPVVWVDGCIFDSDDAIQLECGEVSQKEVVVVCDVTDVRKFSISMVLMSLCVSIFIKMKDCLSGQMRCKSENAGV